MNRDSGIAILHDMGGVSPQATENCLLELSTDDRTRVTEIRSLQRRRQFIFGRHMLRELIYHQLSLRCEVSLLASKQPHVPEFGIHCSISHSGPTVMVGYSLIAPIGVDVEVHKNRNFDRLVENYFHPCEYGTLLKTSEHAKLNWFYETWTLKEARAKANGEGITLKSLGDMPAAHSLPSAFQKAFVFDQFTAAVAHESESEPVLFVAKFDGDSPRLELTTARLASTHKEETP